jgi:hypothetical protein
MAEYARMMRRRMHVRKRKLRSSTYRVKMLVDQQKKISHLPKSILTPLYAAIEGTECDYADLGPRGKILWKDPVAARNDQIQFLLGPYRKYVPFKPGKTNRRPAYMRLNNDLRMVHTPLKKSRAKNVQFVELNRIPKKDHRRAYWHIGVWQDNGLLQQYPLEKKSSFKTAFYKLLRFFGDVGIVHKHFRFLLKCLTITGANASDMRKVLRIADLYARHRSDDGRRAALKFTSKLPLAFGQFRPYKAIPGWGKQVSKPKRSKRRPKCRGPSLASDPRKFTLLRVQDLTF